MKNKTQKISLTFLVLAVFLISSCEQIQVQNEGKIKTFSSGAELVKAFEDSRTNSMGGVYEESAITKTTAALPAADSSSGESSRDYSKTNIQVAGVDEADIVKTDGNYIYYITNNNLAIVKAYPADDAELLYTSNFTNFSPQEMFINGNRLLIFGSSYYQQEYKEEVVSKKIGMPSNEMMYPPIYYSNLVSVRLYDISDKEDPELLREVEFEGDYLTSRKIEDYAYIVINTWPRYYDWPVTPLCDEFIPQYREMDTGSSTSSVDFEPVARCTDIGYIEPIQAQNFITIASISMNNKNEEIEKEIIVGSGQNVYASQDSLYIAQTSYPVYESIIGQPVKEYTEKTYLSKFKLNNGNINFEAYGNVKGHILNQFSMDEYDDYFRIATTSGNFWSNDEEQTSKNNIYVLDENLELTGSLEDLAPGEKIYSSRFIGERAYLVTFKKIDPLFVIDLSDPKNPDILGKLKIPGYSDYLHPYDEDHIIGIGKEAVDASSDLVEQRNLDFAWYQGIKMAIFDVSDVENPVELHKVIIGDRGTDSEALYNHKAFLFDKEKELLVIPITLAEYGNKTPEHDWEYGEYTFQGAYVYNINLDDGFDLKGRITHYTEEDIEKMGYYFYGGKSITRSLYIDNILYTLSNNILKLNDLNDLEELNEVKFEKNDVTPYPLYM